MTRYYFAISFNIKDCNLALLMGRCIYQLHKEFKKLDEQIGISFPGWTNDSIGNEIAFVSTNKKYLQMLSLQTYFQEMKDIGAFNISEIKIVPEECEEVRFIRNQRIAKMFSKDIKRRVIRAKIRADEREEPLVIQEHSKDFEVGIFHSALVTSYSGNQNFVLHIQKETAEQVQTTSFCSYGLATPFEKRGTVPDLRSNQNI